MTTTPADLKEIAETAVEKHFDEMRIDGGELVMLEIIAVADCSVDQACRAATAALIRRSPKLAGYAFFAAIAAADLGADA